MSIENVFVSSTLWRQQDKDKGAGCDKTGLTSLSTISGNKPKPKTVKPKNHRLVFGKSLNPKAGIVRKRYASDKDLMQEDDHGSLPLDAQHNGRCVGVDSSNIVARRGRGSSRSRHERIVSSLPISTANSSSASTESTRAGEGMPCTDVLAPCARLGERWPGGGRAARV